jgi:hypothetical protein
VGKQSMQIRVYNPSMTRGQPNSGDDSGEVNPEILIQQLRIRRARLDSLLRAIQE